MNVSGKENEVLVRDYYIMICYKSHTSASSLLVTNKIDISEVDFPPVFSTTYRKLENPSTSLPLEDTLYEHQ